MTYLRPKKATLRNKAEALRVAIGWIGLFLGSPWLYSLITGDAFLSVSNGFDTSLLGIIIFAPMGIFALVAYCLMAYDLVIYYAFVRRADMTDRLIMFRKYFIDLFLLPALVTYMILCFPALSYRIKRGL